MVQRTAAARTARPSINANEVLHRSGRTDYNRLALEAYRIALPSHEFLPIRAWLGTFYGFQQSWLLDQSRFALTLKCRQVGASHTYAGAAVLWAMLGDTVTVISIGERESLEVLDKAERHAKVLAGLGSDWAKSDATSGLLKLTSGGRVIALPSSSGSRGYSGSVLLDEVAYYQAPEKIWDAAAGAVRLGGRLRALSTPNGVGNFFHTLWTDPKAHKGYRRHKTTLADSRLDGMPADAEECWRMARGDARVFDQLFNCRFIDNDQQYLPSQAIEDALVDDLYCYEGEYFAGLDIGRTHDITALEVIQEDPSEVKWNIYEDTCKRTDWPSIERMVETAFRKHPIRKLCIDSTGLGAFPAEQLQRRYGIHRIELVPFTMGVKEDLVTGLYYALVDSELRLPKGNTQLRDDLLSLRRIVTSAGNVRYDASRSEEGHADRAWALALALHGTTKRGGRKLELTRARPPQPQF